MTGPLSDLRLVELGQLLAGPYCGQLLGDYGAEVIKIEDPKRGDPLRDWGQEKAHGKSLWWPIAARNKKCVTADLRTPEGQQIVKELVEQSDMLLENFRPGTLVQNQSRLNFDSRQRLRTNRTLRATTRLCISW